MSVAALYIQARDAVAILRRIVEADDQNAREEARRFIERLDREEARSKAQADAKQARREHRRTVGRENSAAFEIVPQTENGVHHAAIGIVLAKRGDIRLVWRRSGRYWSGRQQHYAPPELQVLLPDAQLPVSLTYHSNNRTIGKGPRLSRALILRYAEKIDETFGQGTAAKVADLKATVICETDKKDSA